MNTLVGLSITTGDGFSGFFDGFKEIRAHKLRIVAIVSRFYEMKPKVARRKRSKVNWSSGHQRTVVVAPPERRRLRRRWNQPPVVGFLVLAKWKAE
ncbi:hypothetical protein DKX38_029781 [Salix brachista]|uniref:Uncharacterized protein n=1 Tax=Salix brachista TaxID=2182728 RepID=A0A5N5J5P3_9ROSI|nr:hypothetical protein DKX38_029781 [Salix brachista]